MTSRAQLRPTVVVEAWQQNGIVTLDYSVYRTANGQAMKRRKAHRRVLVRHHDQLTEQQLLVLCQRMVTYVLSRSAGQQFIPRNLPWQEVGSTEWSVPPSGGEGGESRTTDGGMAEEGIRS